MDVSTISKLVKQQNFHTSSNSFMLHAVIFDATNKVLKMPIYIKTRKTSEVFTAFLFKDINMQTRCSNYIILNGWKEKTFFITIYIELFTSLLSLKRVLIIA